MKYSRCDPEYPLQDELVQAPVYNKIVFKKFPQNLFFEIKSHLAR